MFWKKILVMGLPNGDNTLVEGQSSGLTGGQKQRLNIARALYHRPQLILFDDVLSALDVKTEIQIMTGLLGRDGLLSKLGATVLFVTHSTHWETIADSVITLDGSGNTTKRSNIPGLQGKVLPTEFNLRHSMDLKSSENVKADQILENPSGGENSQAIDASNVRLPETLVVSEAHIVDIPQHESDSRDYLQVIELKLRSPMYSHFMETLNGLSSIRVLGWQERVTDSMIEKVDRSQVPDYLLYCAQRWLQLVLDLVVAALAIIVITLAIKLHRSTNPGSLSLSLNNILSFNETLSFLLQYWTQLEISLGAISRTREFAHRKLSEPKSLSPFTLPPNWPEHGSIEIRNLNASYAPSTLALNNITLSIHAGEKIGFCGRSGSGKSSLLSTLLRLLEPSSGSITIDGIDLSTINHQTLRERLLTVPQDAFLIQQTIRYNLDPLAQYTDSQLIAALQKVYLWSLFSPLNGLATIAPSNFLSQGQK
ncbi:hypothetical protein BGAL_0332g00050 [Botrytis galanthina]|uniref:ABC transmembrane type-1 domain-containing protein n=1 Tax=Botrytis galanthina TaxID=278940 RepID=A0A4S8R1W1_9HELO|nr:hypothetical protein BGAL_0332g00050 [Botrytis galanthina]